MADVVVQTTTSDNIMDAADLVDAVDLVDSVTATAVDNITDNNENNNADDQDFEAFNASAKTLQGETVAEAVVEAIHAVEQAEIDPKLVVTNPEWVEGEKHKQQQQEEGRKNSVRMASAETKTSADHVGNEAPAAPTTPTNNFDGDNPVMENGDDDNEDGASRYVTPKDFELLKVIGMGAFGKVLQVKNKQSSQILAMKVISKRLLKRKSGYIENVQAERNILKRVNHNFVVKMHCSFQTKEKLFIIMDFLAGGEMFLKLGKEGIFLEKDAAFYLAEMILGVDHLHQLGILHRDLKPENILLGNDGHICLTDFGLAKDFGSDWHQQDGDEDQERAMTICGTQEYMAPEMVANKGYGKAADYWSLGCIAYEMLNGLPPFSSKQGSKELFRKIMSEKVKMPPGSTAAACKLLKGLLNRNPDTRLGAARSKMFEVGGVAGLKQAPFFAKIDWIKLENKEVPPPYSLSVDHDEDVQHFHNEFTDMPLPRSVHQMSKEDHKPRRVQSDTFRGFSFVQDDFSLPQRDADELELYWRSTAEEDGVSDSEIASSKCEFEVDEPPPQPEKKKRPPRKRKKKKKDTAETASVSSSIPDLSTTSSVADLSPTPSINGEAGDDSAAAASTPQIKSNSSVDAKNVTTPATQSVATPVPVAAAKAAPLPAQAKPVTSTTPRESPKTKSTVHTWQSVGASAGKNRSRPGATPTPIRNNNPQTPKSYQPPHRRDPLKRATPSATARPGWTQGPKYATPPRTAPVPGSWAARLQNTSATPSPAGTSITTPSSMTAEPPTPTLSPSASSWSTPKPPTLQRDTSTGSGAPPSPSTDWRHHTSPQVQRAIKRSSLQNSTSPAEGPPSWPSLKGPAPGTKKLNGAPTTPSLKGAWATR